MGIGRVLFPISFSPSKILNHLRTATDSRLFRPGKAEVETVRPQYSPDRSAKWASRSGTTILSKWLVQSIAENGPVHSENDFSPAISVGFGENKLNLRKLGRDQGLNPSTNGFGANLWIKFSYAV